MNHLIIDEKLFFFHLFLTCNKKLYIEFIKIILYDKKKLKTKKKKSQYPFLPNPKFGKVTLLFFFP